MTASFYKDTISKLDGDEMQPAQKPHDYRRHQTWWAVAVAIVATLVMLAIAFTIVRAAGDHLQRTMSEPAVVYEMELVPTVHIYAEAGDIHIHRGSGSTVIIKATKHLGIFDKSTSNPDMITHQNGNIVTIRTKLESYFDLWGGGISFVSLDITLPSTSNIQLGELAGNISINDINGQMAIHNQAGNITLEGSQLSNVSSLSSSAGRISFDGALDQHGSYRFSTTAGDILLTLPSSSSVNINAQATVGSVRNAFGDGPIGNIPQASVGVTAGAGDITIVRSPLVR